MKPLLIYIHGFLSSSQSAKGLMVQKAIADYNVNVELYLPQLSNYPDEAIAHLKEVIERQPENRLIGLIGSSLGGFYATYLSDCYGCRAVLVNPGVDTPQLIHNYLGEQVNPYTGQHFTLTEKHIDVMASLAVKVIQQPELLWLMVQTDDDVCDYRLSVARYQGCRQLVEQGGDHAFQNFDQHLPEVFKFLQLTP